MIAATHALARQISLFFKQKYFFSFAISRREIAVNAIATAYTAGLGMNCAFFVSIHWMSNKRNAARPPSDKESSCFLLPTTCQLFTADVNASNGETT